MPVERRGLGSSRAQEAARDRRLAMSLTPPLKVQKLQTAFHAKAKGSPGYRFYALYDKVYRRDVLGQAFNVCRSHGGVAGGDEQTFRDIQEDGVGGGLDEPTDECGTHG